MSSTASRRSRGPIDLAEIWSPARRAHHPLMEAYRLRSLANGHTVHAEQATMIGYHLAEIDEDGDDPAGFLEHLFTARHPYLAATVQAYADTWRGTRYRRTQARLEAAA